MPSNYRSKVARQMASLVDARMAELRNFSFDELMVVPAGGKDIQIDGRKGFVWTYIEKPEEGNIRVVVQGGVPFRTPFSFVKHVHVVGFIRNNDGTYRELKQEELYEYD